MVDLERMRTFGPEGVREILQDGNFGGYFQRSDEDMNAIWSVAIDETHALIENW
jgi:creatinine amidohydrolase